MAIREDFHQIMRDLEITDDADGDVLGGVPWFDAQNRFKRLPADVVAGFTPEKRARYFYALRTYGGKC